MGRHHLRYRVLATLVLTCLAVPALSQTKGMRVVFKDREGRDVGAYGGSYALVVGVSKYTHGWPVLEAVPGEVDQVATFLGANGFSVTRVIDPDSDKLQNAFEDFIDAHGYDPNNRLLFFFSGHGYTLDDGRRGYLVPADAPDPRQDERNFRRRSLDMTRLLAWCREMQANHALFLFDSCFSGTIFKTRALPDIPPHISVLTAKPVRQFISAGTAGEEVPARSVFTPTILKALRGEADYNKDKFVTGTELGIYLHTKVTDYSAAAGCPQTPQYGKMRDPELDEGDFVFALPRDMATAPKPMQPGDPPSVTVPAVATEVTPVKWPPLTLSAVLGQGTSGAAVIINGRIIDEGRSIDGVTLKSVGRLSCVLEYMGETMVLRLGHSTK